MQKRVRSVLTWFVGVVTLWGQNPLARSADPFAGVFQNEQLKVELARAGAEYKGVIVLEGQSLPVKATAETGKLTGTFESGGKAYRFQATREGDSLSLTTDGVTHVLRTGGGTSGAPAAGASRLVGVWQSPTGLVRIHADGTAEIAGKPSRWTAEGNAITFTGSGETVRVEYELAGEIWTWKFPAGQLVLTRATGTAAAPAPGAVTGSWQGPNGIIQLNPDGTGVVAGVPYRYSLTGDRLTLTGPDGTFVAALQQAGDSMTWVINGKTLTFQRAGQTWALGGGSGSAAIQPDLVGKWCQGSALNNSAGQYGRSACITLNGDGSYQYTSESDASGRAGGGAYGTASAGSDAGTWTASGDSITANSRKTGVRTFRLEKRNHPKTGDPMILLDGEAFTTALKKAPWR